jgi:hypothetical protein
LKYSALRSVAMCLVYPLFFRAGLSRNPRA